MKTQLKLLTIFHLLSFVCLSASAQGTAFTYQGRLNSGGSPASGSYDLDFTIYDANEPAGSWIAGPVTNAAVAVSNGLFTVTLDFGAGVFAGNARWLEIAVRTNGGASFTTLTPRQAITPTPYAIYAASAATAASASSVAAGNISGTVTLAQLPPVLVTNGAAGIALTGTFAGNYGGSFYGNGSGLTGLNASALTSGTVPMAELPATNFWQTGGNTVTAGQFLGSLNNQPLQLIANGASALRLVPDTSGQGSPIVIGGSAANFVANGAVGAFIGGGGATDYFGLKGNSVYGWFGAVVGGTANTNYANWGTLGGGYQNAVGDAGAPSHAQAATVGGGQNNLADAYVATLAGGAGNQATGSGSFIGGGGLGQNYGVWGNTASGFDAMVGGGVLNTASGTNSTISGGQQNTASAEYTTVGGGYGNTASGNYAVVPGGNGNTAGGNYSFAAGNNAIALASGAFVWADSLTNTFNAFAQPGATGIQNSFNVRATGGFYIVTGINTATGLATSEAYLAQNGTSWAVMSDRNAKKDFAPVDYQAVLAKLAGVPIQQWHYKWEKDTDVLNIGPMAQDFKHAFYPGRDDKSITTLEFDGVELAAIQGLNQKLEEKEDKIKELEARLQKLEQLMSTKNGEAR